MGGAPPLEAGTRPLEEVATPPHWDQPVAQGPLSPVPMTMTSSYCTDWFTREHLLDHKVGVCGCGD